MATRPPSPTASASVQVVVRLRPLNEKEKKHGTLPVVSASTSEKTVTVIKGQGSRQIRSNYKFDNVFTAFSSQEEVFEATLKPVIRDVLRGFESTVFAYGQTGTGKTHTMEGNLSDPEMHGVIPRSAAAIFKELNAPEYSSKSVSCSFLEIYNEDLCDLLADPVFAPTKRQKLDIMEGKNGPFCRGLSERTVESADDVFCLMQKAQQQRQVGETNMNKQSSRSHCLFTLRIEAKKALQDGSVLEVAGKLHCVDLAGSECAKSANLEKGNESQGARERERMNINRSLLTLGRVVSMLKEKQSGNKKRARIPYRDSKLTRILQESLGGRCKTCLIATVSPSVTAIEESMSTLNYAQAANGIMNKPITTSLMTSQGASMNGSSKQAGSSGDNAACSVEHWQEMECRLEYMKNQVEEAQSALARKHLQQQELVERAERAESSRKDMSIKYEEATKQVTSLEEKIQAKEEENKELSEKLSKTESTLRRTVVVLEATQTTEVNLTNEAKALLEALDQSIREADKVYESLHKSREDSIKQREATQLFKVSLLAVFKNIHESLEQLKSAHKENRDKLSTTATENGNMDRDFLDQTQSIVEATSLNINGIASTLERQLIDDGGIVESINTIGDSTRDSLHQMNEHFSANESELRSTFDSIRQDMSKAASTMKKIQQAYMDSSTDVLELLESSIAESNSKLAALVSAATEAIAKQSEEAAKRRQNMLNISAGWKSSTLESTQRVRALATEESNSVDSMFQVLTEQLQKQEVVRSHLREREDHINESRSSHLRSLQGQAHLLKCQEEELRQTHKLNNQCFQQFAKEVMDGVQDLLQCQMEKLTQNNEERHALLMSKTKSVVESNDVIRQSATNIIDSAELSNKLFQSHSEDVHGSDSKAVSVLESAKKVLDEIQDTSEKIESDSSAHQNAMLEEAEEADCVATTTCTEIEESLSEDSNNLQHHLTCQVSDRTKEYIGSLTESNKRVSIFVEENLVRNIASALKEKIEVPIAEFSEKLRDQTASTVSTMDKGLQTVNMKALNQKNIIASLQTSMNSSAGDLSERILKQLEATKSREGAFIDTVTTHEKAVLKKLSSSLKQASAGSKSFVDYTQFVIKADEPVPELETRSAPSFSKSLSTTLPEDEILANFPEDASNGLPVSALSGKENCPSSRETSCRSKKRRSMSSSEEALSGMSSNSITSANDVDIEKLKRPGENRRKQAHKNRGSKKLRLSIPKYET